MFIQCTEIFTIVYNFICIQEITQGSILTACLVCCSFLCGFNSFQSSHIATFAKALGERGQATFWRQLMKAVHKFKFTIGVHPQIKQGNTCTKPTPSYVHSRGKLNFFLTQFLGTSQCLSLHKVASGQNMFYCNATTELLQLFSTWERYYSVSLQLLEAEMQILGSYSQTQKIRE